MSGIVDPSQATPVPSIAERTAALEAMVSENGQPAEVRALDIDGPGVDEGEEGGEQQPETDVEEQAAPTKPEKPRVKPLGNPPPEDDTAAEGDIDQVAAAQRDIVRQRRERQREQLEFEQGMASLQRERLEFDRQRQQVLELQQRLATPEGVLEYFEQQGGNGQQIGEFIVQANDPSRRAASEAKKALSPIEQELKRTQERIAEFEKQQAVTQITSDLTKRVNELAASDEYAEDVQYTAGILEADREHFLQAADAVCLRLGQKTDPFGRRLPFDYDDVIIEVEKQFAREAARYGAQKPKGANGSKQAPKAPATKPATAKAQARNVNQQTAGGRTVIAEEPDFSMLSPKDRAAALEREYLRLERGK